MQVELATAEITGRRVVVRVAVRAKRSLVQSFAHTILRNVQLDGRRLRSPQRPQGYQTLIPVVIVSVYETLLQGPGRIGLHGHIERDPAGELLEIPLANPKGQRIIRMLRIIFRAVCSHITKKPAARA